MSLRGLKYRLEYGLFRLLAGVAERLPLETASQLSGWLWRHIAPVLARHQRAVTHLRRAFPDKSEQDIERIARDMWENLGRVFAEGFHLQEIVHSGRIVFDNLDELKALGLDKTSLIACAAHLANWEIGVQIVHQLGGQPMGIYRRLKNPFVDEYIHRMRAPFYPGELLHSDSSTGLKAARHLKSGGSLALLADLRDRHGLLIHFFDQPAYASTFPALLGRKLGRQILAVHVIREAGVRFRITGHVIAIPHTANVEADMQQATIALQAKLEEFIRQTPEQWMWAHRRWEPRKSP